MQNVAPEVIYTNAWLQVVLNQTMFVQEQLMEILNNASITIKNLLTIVLIVMPQHSQIRYGTSKKVKNKKKTNKTPVLKQCILRTIPSYSNTTKKCLHEKLEILYYPNTDELIKKLSELIVKCRHANKYLPCNYKSRD